MPIKLVMLYPHPLDPEAFDKYYIDHHLPAVRQLVGPGVPMPTYKPLPRGTRPAPYYRMAEIHFPSREAFDAFVQSSESKARYELLRVASTGGEPVALVCVEQQHEAPA